MLQAVGERVLVTAPSYDRITQAGIAIVETSNQARIRRGTVVSVGAGYKDHTGVRQSIEVEVGEEVLYITPGPVEVADRDGNKFMALRPLDIVAVERPDAQKPKKSKK